MPGQARVPSQCPLDSNSAAANDRHQWFRQGKGCQQADDSQHIVTEEDPSCHLPHIHSATTSSGVETTNDASSNPGSKNADPLCITPAGCTLKMTTVTQLIYQTGSEFDVWRESTGNDNFDTGYWPISASEMKAKMKSQIATMFQAANDTGAVSGSTSFDDLDAPEQGNCALINTEGLEVGD